MSRLGLVLSPPKGCDRGCVSLELGACLTDEPIGSLGGQAVALGYLVSVDHATASWMAFAARM